MNRKTYISNDILSLVEYQKSDDRVLYENWLDPDTQKGYNGVYVTTFEEFQSEERRQRFFAMIQLNDTKEIIGAIGISPPETIADLAIWVFNPYRRQGYGKLAFGLATKYAVDILNIKDLHAGAYLDNIGSLKMLNRCGYISYPDGNILEKHFLTGEEIIQMDFVYKPISIRLANSFDASDMAEIHMRSWEVAYKDIISAEYIREKNITRLELWQRIITDDNNIHYVIQMDKKTVGIMTVVPTPQDNDANHDTCELEGIYLHSDYYRMGIGTQAMEFAFKLARQWNKTIMTLWVFKDNKNSIKFYEKCGFKSDAKTKSYQMGKPIDCIRMRKNLDH